VSLGNTGAQKQKERHYCGTNPFGRPLFVILVLHKNSPLKIRGARPARRTSSLAGGGVMKEAPIHRGDAAISWLDPKFQFPNSFGILTFGFVGFCLFDLSF
jgi:hypothetical protein